MESEETVPDMILPQDLRLTGLEEPGHPSITETAITDASQLINHPIDALAALALTQAIALGSMTHLFLGEPAFGNNVLTEVGVVGNDH
jgi:hypothetical protein